MFKTRLKAWGVSKHRNQRREIEAILCVKAQRDAIGKTSEFTSKGRRVDLKDVERYRKRNGICVDDLLTSKPSSPVHLACVTPPRVERSLVAPGSGDRGIPVRL